MVADNGPSADVLLEIYRKSSLIEQTDRRVRGLVTQGKLHANYYSPRGQEIVAAAMAVNLNIEDYIVTTYRGLHDHLAKGIPLDILMAEYFGKATGSCKGKGGCMHITHPASGVMVTTGIVGSGLPIANGLALASQERKDGRVTVVNFGDGATNIGAFHESLNLASLWRLPVIFLCHNNLFAEHTATENCTAGSIVGRAAGYGMVGVKVNGNDPVEMYRAAHDAVDRARSGDGPTLIEAMTFRFHGHNLGDPGKYIPADMYAAAVANDPLSALRAKLIADGLADEASIEHLESVIDADITAAVAFAQESPPPDPRELRIDVFAEELAA